MTTEHAAITKLIQDFERNGWYTILQEGNWVCYLNGFQKNNHYFNLTEYNIVRSVRSSSSSDWRCPNDAALESLLRKASRELSIDIVEEPAPNATATTDKPLRYNEGKPQMSYLELKPFVGVVRVLEKGAELYGKDNWKTNGGFEYNELLDSFLRHFMEVQENVWSKDVKTGEYNIDHAIANLYFFRYKMMKQEEAKLSVKQPEVL